MGSEEGVEEAVVELGVEHSGPDAVGGGDVGVGVGDAQNEAFEAESSEVVGHLRLL